MNYLKYYLVPLQHKQLFQFLLIVDLNHILIQHHEDFFHVFFYDIIVFVIYVYHLYHVVDVTLLIKIRKEKKEKLKEKLE